MAVNTITPLPDVSDDSKSHPQLEESNTPGWFWWFYLAIILGAILSRFWGLTDKPFHHDESLHAYYSHIIATGGVRDYDPLLHGPFLYYFVGAYQSIAGFAGDLFGIHGLAESDFVARTPAAFFGILVVVIPILLRKYVGHVGVLVLSSLLLISPTTMYFGRFLREDVFTSIWVLGAVFGGLLAAVLPDDRQTTTALRLPGTRLSLNLRTIFPGTPRTNAALFSTIMMAFHFTNKENSFLHAGLWILAIAAILSFDRLFGTSHEPWKTTVPIKGEPLRRLISCASWFLVIFVTLFSSLFRHTAGWYAGVLDGLYRKSLVYWWGQDQVRRIDGPFDYHIPILANYEFLLIPFLVLAWCRTIHFSRVYNTLYPMRRFVLTATRLRTRLTWILITILALAVLFLPRVAMVPDACSLVDIPCSTLTFGVVDCRGHDKSFACLLHISHTRHLLQIVFYILVGAIAFFSSLHTRRRFEAFLWFWFTGAIGTYSYVGEKVPWLTIYILLPMLLIAGLELTRLLTRSELPLYLDASVASSKERVCMPRLTPALRLAVITWLIVAVPFTLWKALRVAIIQPANPDERLIFTQTTPEIRTIQKRFIEAKSSSFTKNVRIGIEGEATWPVAWFALSFREFDFLNTAEGFDSILNKPRFDAMFLNETNIDELKKLFPGHQIFRVPLRAWWVPKPNPTVAEMLAYFFTAKPYPQEADASDATIGKGNTSVLYLEYAGDGSPFQGVAPLSVGERL